MLFRSMKISPESFDCLSLELSTDAYVDVTEGVLADPEIAVMGVQHRPDFARFLSLAGAYACDAAGCLKFQDLDQSVKDRIDISRLTSVEFKDLDTSMKGDPKYIYSAVKANLSNIWNVEFTFGENVFSATSAILMAIGARVLAIPGNIWSWLTGGR